MSSVCGLWEEVGCLQQVERKGNGEMVSSTVRMHVRLFATYVLRLKELQLSTLETQVGRRVQCLSVFCYTFV